MPQNHVGRRKAVSKKARFEVFKRDSFTCQYCGASSPSSVLHVDHIKPVAEGGDNSIVNLITACSECNLGKGKRELSDDSAVSKQKDQLDELNRRREQIEMMLQWRESLKDIDGISVIAVSDSFHEQTGFVLTEDAKKAALRLIKKYGLTDVLNTLDECVSTYFQFGSDGSPEMESAATAWDKVGMLLKVREMPEHEQRILYIRGIIRNRVGCDMNYALMLLKQAYENGADLDHVENEAKCAKRWCDFRDYLDSFTGEENAA